MWLCGLLHIKRNIPATEADGENVSDHHGLASRRHLQLQLRAPKVRLELTAKPSSSPAASSSRVLYAPEDQHTVEPLTDETFANRSIKLDGILSDEEQLRARTVSHALVDVDVKGADLSVLKAVLNHLCYPVTLVGNDGSVILQNDASRRLWGDYAPLATANKPTCSTVPSGPLTEVSGSGRLSPLQLMFSRDRDAFADALAQLEEGRVWRGLLQMPPASDVLRTLPGSALGSPGPAHAILPSLEWTTLNNSVTEAAAAFAVAARSSSIPTDLSCLMGPPACGDLGQMSGSLGTPSLTLGDRAKPNPTAGYGLRGPGAACKERERAPVVATGLVAVRPLPHSLSSGPHPQEHGTPFPRMSQVATCLQSLVSETGSQKTGPAAAAAPLRMQPGPQEGPHVPSQPLPSAPCRGASEHRGHTSAAAADASGGGCISAEGGGSDDRGDCRAVWPSALTSGLPSADRGTSPTSGLSWGSRSGGPSALRPSTALNASPPMRSQGGASGSFGSPGGCPSLGLQLQNLRSTPPQEPLPQKQSWCKQPEPDQRDAKRADTTLKRSVPLVLGASQDERCVTATPPSRGEEAVVPATGLPSTSKVASWIRQMDLGCLSGSEPPAVLEPPHGYQRVAIFLDSEGDISRNGEISPVRAPSACGGCESILASPSPVSAAAAEAGRGLSPAAVVMSALAGGSLADTSAGPAPRSSPTALPRPSSVQSPTSSGHPHSLLAEGLATSALGILARGLTRREPRRNASALALQLNSVQELRQSVIGPSSLPGQRGGQHSFRPGSWHCPPNASAPHPRPQPPRLQAHEPQAQPQPPLHPRLPAYAPLDPAPQPQPQQQPQHLARPQRPLRGQHFPHTTRPTEPLVSNGCEWHEVGTAAMPSTEDDLSSYTGGGARASSLLFSAESANMQFSGNSSLLSPLLSCGTLTSHPCRVSPAGALVAVPSSMTTRTPGTGSSPAPTRRNLSVEEIAEEAAEEEGEAMRQEAGKETKDEGEDDGPSSKPCLASQRVLTSHGSMTQLDSRPSVRLPRRESGAALFSTSVLPPHGSSQPPHPDATLLPNGSTASYLGRTDPHLTTLPTALTTPPASTLSITIPTRACASASHSTLRPSSAMQRLLSMALAVASNAGSSQGYRTGAGAAQDAAALWSTGGASDVSRPLHQPPTPAGPLTAAGSFVNLLGANAFSRPSSALTDNHTDSAAGGNSPPFTFSILGSLVPRCSSGPYTSAAASGAAPSSIAAATELLTAPPSPPAVSDLTDSLGRTLSGPKTDVATSERTTPVLCAGPAATRPYSGHLSSSSRAVCSSAMNAPLSQNLTDGRSGDAGASALDIAAPGDTTLASGRGYCALACASQTPAVLLATIASAVHIGASSGPMGPMGGTNSEQFDCSLGVGVGPTMRRSLSYSAVEDCRGSPGPSSAAPAVCPRGGGSPAERPHAGTGADGAPDITTPPPAECIEEPSLGGSALNASRGPLGSSRQRPEQRSFLLQPSCAAPYTATHCTTTSRTLSEDFLKELLHDRPGRIPPARLHPNHLQLHVGKPQPKTSELQTQAAQAQQCGPVQGLAGEGRGGERDEEEDAKVQVAAWPVHCVAGAPDDVHWHEVTLTSFTHPALKKPAIMMVQNDVSTRIWAERQVARVMEAEHALLENIFPIHVLQHIAATAAQAPDVQESVAAPQLSSYGLSLNPYAAAATTANTAGTGAASPTAALLAARGSSATRAAMSGILPTATAATAPKARPPPGLPLAGPPAVHITGDTFLHLATSHSALTVLFCDIQGFTTMCNLVKPATVMAFLNDLYTRLDAMLDAFGVYKVETIGDCYVAAGGLMKVDEETGAVTVRSDDVDPQHAHRTVQFAKALLRAASNVRLPTTGEPVRLRVGIHSGPAMSGVVGTRMPRFCLFGDTINTASRMESTGVPGAIHVSQATRDLVPEEAWESTGGVEAKGKGLLQTYLLSPPAGAHA